jgi:hypothetical protein
VHGRRVRKTHRAAHETLDPGPQIAGLALDALGGLFADSVRLGGEMPLVRAPSIRGKPWDTTGLQQARAFENDGSLASPAHGGAHGPTGVSHRRPPPPRRGWLPHIPPPRIAL